MKRSSRHPFALAISLSAVLLGATVAQAQTIDSDNDGVPDQTDAEPCDPSVVAIAYAPAEGQSSSMLFEDQWPSQGDLDFNDLALSFNYALRQDAAGNVVKLTATFNALALGGVFDNGFGLHLPVPTAQIASVTRTVGSGTPTPLLVSSTETEATVFVFDNLRELFSGQSGQINSDPGQAQVQGQHFVVEVTFANPVALSITGAPYDPFIFRTQDPSIEVHRPEFAGTSRMNGALFGTQDDGSTASRHFVDIDGLPFVLVFPTTVAYPKEGVSISTLYPDIVRFASSGGTQAVDFYQTNVNAAAAYVDVSGNGPLTPIPPAPHVPDLSCVSLLPRPTVDAGPDQTVNEGSPFTGSGVFLDGQGISWIGTVDYGAGPVALALAPNKTFQLTTTFADDGVFPVAVQITADDGRIGTDTVDVTVQNVAPTVAAGPDGTVTLGQAFVQTGTVTDPGADVITATVDYGDGVGAGPLTVAGDGTFSLNRNYASTGTFVITVVATDDDGGTDTQTIPVTVVNPNVAPVVTPAGPATINEGSTFSDSASFTDDGIGPWTATVDYGDGTGVQSLAVGAGNLMNLSHVYADDGVFTVTVNVTDPAGNVGTASTQVNVQNVDPLAIAGNTITIPLGGIFSRTATVTDPGADTFVGTVDYGDGTPAQALVFVGRQFSLQHTYANEGVYAVSISVNDDDGGTGSTTLQIIQDGPVPSGACSATAVTAISHSAFDGGANRDAATTFPPQNMLDGDLATRSRFRTGGSPAYFVDLTLSAPSTIASVRTFVPVGIQTGYAGIRILTDDGSGFVERYIDTRLFGIAGRFASSATLGGIAFASGQVGLQGEVDHIFPAGPVTGVTAIRLEVGYIDEITPEAPGGGDSVYSIYELSFCGAFAPTQSLPQLVVDAGPDLNIIEGTPVSIQAQATLLTASSATAQVLWGDGTAPETHSVPISGSFPLSHAYPGEGQYTLLVNVTQPDGTLGSDQVQIAVVNGAPTVTLNGPTSGTTGTSLTVTGQVLDPGNDPVTASIDWGDGTIESLTLAGDGSYAISHTYANAGTFAAAVSATDDAAASSSANLSIVVTVSCPTGFADCDNNPANGCEDLSSLSNCGTCGNACSGLDLCVNGSCQSHCLDGVLSGNETGVDCGGSCPACPTCSDGIRNQGEIAVDCGGPCPITCVVEFCNGLDDNANGVIDDNPVDVGTACTAGVGACASVGAEICSGGSLVCSGTIGAPVREICGDGVDNDCDGTVDERCTDTEGPVVNASWNPAILSAGSPSTLTVSTTDPAGAASVVVTVNGSPLALVGGAATFTPASPGIYTTTIVATDGLGNTTNSTTYVRAIDPTDVTPPTSGITSPIAGDTYSTNAPINGTASDANFFEYRLQYALAGSSQFTTYHSSTTPVSNGVLGTLPTDRVPPGTYAIRVVVEDVNGTTTISEVVVNLAGAERPGHVAFCLHDGNVQVAGIKIAVDRCYDNGIKDTRDFGVGWFLATSQGSAAHSVPLDQGWVSNPVCIRSAFGICVEQGCELLETRAHKTVVHLGNGEFLRFSPQFTFGGLISGACTGTMTFVSDPTNAPGWSLPNSLSVVALNSGGPLTDSGFATLAMDTFTLDGPDGQQIGLDVNSGVTSYRNEYNETVNFSATGISHSGGLGVGFARDGQGRVNSLAVPATGAVSYLYDAAGDLTEVRDGLARSTLYAYDGQHNLTSIATPDGSTQILGYDAEGRIAGFENLAGATVDVNRSPDGLTETYAAPGVPGLTVQYDPLGNITAQNDGLGNITTFGFDANGNNTSITNPANETTTLRYDGLLVDRVTLHDGTVALQATLNAAGEYTQIIHGNSTLNSVRSGNTVTLTDAQGALVWSEVLDAQGNIIQLTTGTGVETYQRDADGRVTTQTDPKGRIDTLAYDAAGRITATSGPLGSWTGQRDAAGQLTRIVDPLVGTTDFAFDAAGRLTAADVTGSLITYEYDSNGRQTLVRKEDGRFEETLYDWRGHIAQYRGFDGTVRQMVYDNAGRLTSTDFGDGTFETIAYDVAGRVTQETDRLGRVTSTAYDSAGRVTSTGDAFGTNVLTYDAAGTLASITSPAGRTIGISRPVGNTRQFTIATGGGQSLTATLDAAGVIDSMTDAGGNTVSLTPNYPARELVVTKGVTTATFRYHTTGSLREVVDSRGGSTALIYDGSGRPTQLTLPDATAETYAYDAASNVTRWVRGDSSVIDYAFDPSGNVTATTHDGITENAAYNLNGKRTEARKGTELTTYEHDTAGRITKTTAPWGGISEYGYDATGLRTLVRTRSSATDPGRTTTYLRDARGFVTQMGSAAGTTTYQYDPDGLPTFVTYSNGTQIERSYDAAAQLTQVLHRAPGGAVVSGYAQTFDNTGHLTRVVHSSGRTVDYGYDSTGRIALEVRTPATGTPRTFTYGYDNDNNLTSVVDSVAGTTTYTYDLMDRLVSDSAGNAYAYDGRGNLTSQIGPAGSRTYEFDSLDRMTAVTFGGGRWQYLYDDEGRRVGIIEPNGTRHDYLVDVTQDLYQVLEEVTAGVVSRSWTYNGGVEQTIVAGQTYFHMPDERGSTAALTDPTGAITDTFEYSAYGSTLGRTGTTAAPHRYVGQWEDTSGLYNLRARYYSTTHGRFLSRDRDPPREANPLTVNRYLYGLGDPITHVDPSGRFFGVSFSFGFGSLLSVVGWGMSAVSAYGVLRVATRAFNSAFNANLLQFGKLSDYQSNWDAGLDVFGIVTGPFVGIYKGYQVAGALAKHLRGLNVVSKMLYKSPALQKAFITMGKHGIDSAEFAASLSAAGFKFVRGEAAVARIAQLSAAGHFTAKAKAVAWGDEIIVTSLASKSTSQVLMHGKKSEVAAVLHELKHADQYISAAKKLYNVGDGAIDSAKIIQASNVLHGLPSTLPKWLNYLRVKLTMLWAETGAVRAQNFGAGLSLF